MQKAFAVRTVLVIVVLALGIGAYVTPAAAVSIISNYPPANDNVAALLSSTSSVAAGFTMPGGASYTLDSVTLRLQITERDVPLQVDLFGDSGGNPVGPARVGFAIPPLPDGLSDVTVTPSVPFTLLPSTTYWVAATSAFDGLGVFWVASDPGITPTGIASFAGYRADSSGVYPPTDLFEFMTTYEVHGTLVPEPSTLT